jgi:hypothetical protein
VHHNKIVQYTTATRAQPDHEHAKQECNAAFLAMPRGAIELVAQATRYSDQEGLDVLNHENV